MRQPGRGPRHGTGARTLTGPRVLVLAALLLAACGGDPPVEAALDPEAPAVVPLAEPTPLQGLRYEVEPGDTLWDIAQRHDTTPGAIVQASGVVDPDRLDVGDVLTIPPPGPPVSADTGPGREGPSAPSADTVDSR